jgi:hypothetical protein
MANVWFRSFDRPLAQARNVFPIAILSAAQLNRTLRQNRYAKLSNSFSIPYSNRTQNYHSPNTLETKKTSTLSFWSSPVVWKRAGINTFRCLIGCSLGDFSAMWFLQANYPDLGMGTVMATSSKICLQLSSWTGSDFCHSGSGFDHFHVAGDSPPSAWT